MTHASCHFRRFTCAVENSEPHLYVMDPSQSTAPVGRRRLWFQLADLVVSFFVFSFSWSSTYQPKTFCWVEVVVFSGPCFLPWKKSILSWKECRHFKPQSLLVGGFNPSEKSQFWIISPCRVKITNSWNHHKVLFSSFKWPFRPWQPWYLHLSTLGFPERGKVTGDSTNHLRRRWLLAPPRWGQFDVGTLYMVCARALACQIYCMYTHIYIYIKYMRFACYTSSFWFFTKFWHIENKVASSKRVDYIHSWLAHLRNVFTTNMLMILTVDGRNPANHLVCLKPCKKVG